MKDVQKKEDTRGIAIDKVGVKGVELPFKIKDMLSEFQTVVGSWNAYVRLKKEVKGTHMSRFIEILQRYRERTIDLEIMNKGMKPQIRRVLEARRAHLEVEFKYFIRKESPVSKIKCMMPVNCKFEVSDYSEPRLIVKTPITTLCPCSKEISKYGAHNQRSYVTISVAPKGWVWIEEIVDIAESSSSSGVFPVLKRPDEKAVTEHAYDNPKFVEDVVREVVKRIRRLPISRYQVICENHESIHVHNAFAEVKGRVKQKTWERAIKHEGQKRLDEL